jgi:hypothetical protein
MPKPVLAGFTAQEIADLEANPHPDSPAARRAARREYDRLAEFCGDGDPSEML